MLRDTATFGDGEPACCASCKRPVGAAFVIITCPACPEIDGTYHPECAKPFDSIVRALAMMERPWG